MTPTESLRTLAHDVPKLVLLSQKLLRQVQRQRRYLIATVLVVVLVAGLAYQVYRTEGCLKAWADARTARDTALVKPLALRNRTFDKLLADLADPTKKDNLAIIGPDFVNASLAASAYEQATDAHPLPPPPGLNCSLLP